MLLIPVFAAMTAAPEVGALLVSMPVRDDLLEYRAGRIHATELGVVGEARREK